MFGLVARPGVEDRLGLALGRRRGEVRLILKGPAGYEVGRLDHRQRAGTTSHLELLHGHPDGRSLPRACRAGRVDALRLCHYKSPDLLVLDLMLPDAAGLDVLREIRATDRSNGRHDPSLPVVVLSGRIGGRPGARVRRGRTTTCGNLRHTSSRTAVVL